ncbi:MAG: hypothetical protein HZA90_03645 [Verrucomicrobia bacterium]|nr:hypothetical protein [Verrucomicrobiota bacterium]
MGQRVGPGLPAGVTELRERIERWRRTRERRTAMPAKLWAEAIRFSRRGRPYAVARALGVNFESLKRRMAEAGARMPVGASAAFVELSGAQVLGAAAVPACVVELLDGDGTRLTVRLAGGAEVDVAGIVTAFKRGGA